MRANEFANKASFLEGVVLVIDKPLEWTSFDVVNKVRGMIRHKLGIKKIKVGHAGTLDPLATGVLVLCTGRMTKSINQYMAQDKEYTGEIMLGKTTPSYDLETEVDQEWPIDHITPDRLEESRKKFIGPLDQLPPIFSAKKIDGKVAYKQARKGKTIELKTSQVIINTFDIDAKNLPLISFEVCCSKGTYIRSLAHDFGKSLDSGGYLASLRRTRSGDFAIEDAITVEALQARIDALND
jgi:tRNA pseudouridine55 synthase